MFKIGRQTLTVQLFDFVRPGETKRAREWFYRHLESDVTGRHWEPYSYEDLYSSKTMALSSRRMHSEQQSTGSEAKCRVCHGAETALNTFARDVCKCSSAHPAHVFCLIKWLSRKARTRVREDLTYYCLESMKCELCQAAYPRFVRWNQKTLPLLRIEVEPHKRCLFILIHRINSPTIRFLVILDVSLTAVREYLVGGSSEACFKFPVLKRQPHQHRADAVAGRG